MSETVEVSKDELKTLCDQILSEWYSEVERGKNAYLECSFCPGYVFWDDNPKDILHNTDCIYLIAKGIRDSLRD